MTALKLNVKTLSLGV